MSRRKQLVAAIAATAALAGGVLAAEAAFSDTGPTEVAAVRLVVFARPGASDADRTAQMKLVNESLDDALDFLAANGRTLERRPTVEVLESDLGTVLVEFDEAADPCSASRWQDEVEGVEEIRDDEIPVLLGGIIRSTSAFAGLAGAACGPRVDDCGADVAVAGRVLVDSYPNERVELSALFAHELAHILGVAHTDTPGPCGAKLVAGTGDQSTNLMSEKVHAGLLPQDAPKVQVTLDEVTLTEAQQRVLEASENADA